MSFKVAKADNTSCVQTGNDPACRIKHCYAEAMVRKQCLGDQAVYSRSDENALTEYVKMPLLALCSEQRVQTM